VAEIENYDEVKSKVNELRAKINEIGPVNMVAMEEYDELVKRHEFLTKQEKDLVDAKESLHRIINNINQTTRTMFSEAFEKIKTNFREIFRELFGGGEADLVLIDEGNLLETGIDIVARPPGKRLQSIGLLSGGERALTAIALLFALFKLKPSPFCILDEIDAPLDDVNIKRFTRMLKEFSATTQFIVITHSKITMEAADEMYGVTMEEPGVSKIISVKLN
jgi:chromosome segregation protein